MNNSQNVEIYGNEIEAVGTNAICIVNSQRTEPAMFPQNLANVSVHDNIIKMRGMVSFGMVGNTQPANISFKNNTYYVDNLSAPNWAYFSDQINRGQWQAGGQDVTGKFLTW